MKTVGEILQKARLKQNLALEDVARYTKISLRYLQAIEANDFTNLPASAFTKGFLQNYAKVVQLDPQAVLAIFRRDYDQDEKGRIIPRGLSSPVKPPRYSLNPTTVSIILSVLASLLILTFFIRQVITFTSAPPLDITSPSDNSRLTSPVTVTGHTVPEATLTINNQSIPLDENGSFSTNINLTPGQHTLVITSTSRSNKQRTLQRVIEVTP